MAKAIGDLAGVSCQRVNQAQQRFEGERLLAIDCGGTRIVDIDGPRSFES